MERPWQEAKQPGEQGQSLNRTGKDVKKNTQRLASPAPFEWRQKAKTWGEAASESTPTVNGQFHGHRLPSLAGLAHSAVDFPTREWPLRSRREEAGIRQALW